MSDTLVGNDGDNVLTGNGGTDYITGGLGNDRIDGGAGIDFLGATVAMHVDFNQTGAQDTGEGMDIITNMKGFYGSAFNDTVVASATTTEVHGGDGGDTLVLTGNSADYTLTQFFGQGQVSLTGGGTITFDGIETVKFADKTVRLVDLGTPRITGDLSANLTGSATYVLTTQDLAATDPDGDAITYYIDKTYGGDVLVGGVAVTSFTTAQLAAGQVSFHATPYVSPADSGFTVRPSDDFPGAGTFSYFMAVQVLTGQVINDTDAGHVLAGTDGNDIIYGNGGNDTITSGFGDVIYGGDGDDVVIYGGGTLDGGAGFDIINYANSQMSVTVDLADSTAHISSFEGVTGSAYSDVLFATDGANRLDGGGGTDVLYGLKGDDSYYVDSYQDMVIEGDNEGHDTVFASVSYSLANVNSVEDIVLTGKGNIDATGNYLGNSLAGNAGNNWLDGGAGDDTYSIQNVGDVVVELADQGVDTVKANLAAYTLGANIENLILTGSGNVNGTGNDLNNVITGNGADNTLLGGKGDDILNGGNGNDILNGGTGFDRMNGGAGNDTYYYGSGDTIIEPENGGIDLVMSTVPSMTLGYTLENVTLVEGSTAINANGNNLDNVMIGNSAANILQGGGGNDTIDGGAGNDTINGGKGADILTGGAGADTFVYNSLNDSLANSTTNKTFYDRITDFGAGDKIDLHLIDANVHLGGDQAFHQVAAFTGHEAEMTLVYGAGNNTTILSLDANGDKKPDFIILLTGSHTDSTGWLL